MSFWKYYRAWMLISLALDMASLSFPPLTSTMKSISSSYLMKSWSLIAMHSSFATEMLSVTSSIRL